MIEKFFELWQRLKIKIHQKNEPLHFREKEIWWTYVGQNIGYENCGKFPNFTRPVLVIKKFNNESFFGIPLTSQNKKGRYYHSFPFQEKTSTALLSQLKQFDSKRLKKKMGYINIKYFLEIQKKDSRTYL